MSNKKKLLIFGGAVVVVGALIFVSMRRGKGGEIEVQTEKVARSNVVQTVSGSGKVQPEVEVKISANVAGEIIRMHVKEGDRVAKGRVLFELDRARYTASYERAVSTLQSAEAALLKSRSSAKRADELYAKNLFSLAELEVAKADLAVAQSNVDQARASVTQAKDDLSKTTLISPMDGVVTKINKEQGEIALGSSFQADVVMTIADLAKMEMVAQIDENDVVLIQLGDSARIEIDAIQDVVFNGQVYEIAHTATTTGRGTQEEVTNFDVKIKIVDNVEKLRPGMSSSVDIVTEVHPKVLNVPIQCITVRDKSALKDTTVQYTVIKSKSTTRLASSESTGGGEGGDGAAGVAKVEVPVQVVFINDNGVAKMLPVVSGISNDTNVEITSGLEDGQAIITGPYKVLSRSLKDGDKLKTKKEKEQQGKPSEKKASS
jgi:HlyD family secretion protein